jgi:hypothetical protein
MARARASNKEIGHLLREIEQQGWTVTGGGTRHFKAKCPNRCRCMITLASSSSNQLAVRRARTHLQSKTCWKEQP